jgi:hypothetical protein
MNTRWLVVVLLLVTSCLAAKARYSEKQVINYAKALDVTKLDPTLSSQRLDEWIRSGPAHLGMVTWEMSDCDLKGGDPNIPAPLCVKIRFNRDGVGGWVIITVGTFRDGIKGEPRVEDILVGSQNGGEPYSNKLSDLARLLDDASRTTKPSVPAK